MKKMIGYFTCGKNELERIDEGLQNRNIDVDAIISIIDSGSFLTILYRYEVIGGDIFMTNSTSPCKLTR